MMKLTLVLIAYADQHMI